MKIRFILLSLAFVLFASVASAQCLTCQRVGPITNPATCRPTEIAGYCSGICCISPIDTACTQPDEIFACDEFAANVEGSEKKFFTTARPQQIQFASTGLRLGQSLKGKRRCAASKLLFT